MSADTHHPSNGHPSDEHPSNEQIALFVMRAFDQVTFDDIESHLDGCDACADRLAAEAQLELEMQALASTTQWCPRCGVASVATCLRCGIALKPGGYEVEAVLSEYGQGRTYRGRAPDGSRVRISELEFSHVRDHGVIESFVKDATLLAQLDHPNIPKLVDSFQEGDDEHLRLYAVEAWVEGEPLDEVLDNHRFDETEARHIAEQVLDVLVYLQGLSPAIFHRDVRPQNLLFAEGGTVYLRQFANARDMSVTGAFTLAGHTGYIPAEQHLGVVDATSDLYGLGATLAHVLTRRAPLPGDPGLERANVSPELEAWLKRLMAMRPEARFPSAVAARDALFEPAPPKRRRVTALSVATAMILAAAAALAVAGVTFLTSPTVPPPPPKPAVPKTGVLHLESNPSGARIFVDGVPMGTTTTPADLSELTFGRTYAIRLELDGHAPYTTAKTMDESLDGDIVHHTFVALAPPEDTRTPPRPTKTRSRPKRPPPPAAPAPPATNSPPGTTGEPPVDEVEALRSRPFGDYSDRPSTKPPIRDIPDGPPGCQVDRDRPPGYVTLATKPYAEVFWGKRRLGQTPLARVQLPSGCIELRAIAIDGSKRRTVRVEVRPSEVAIYRFALE
ncbi:MAG: serine/threonine-protein kinase [Deltaproteobacteria bacterium]|jgi:serine/threonine protein kinase